MITKKRYDYKASRELKYRSLVPRTYTPLVLPEEFSVPNFPHYLR
jgi:hypothetical protein